MIDDLLEAAEAIPGVIAMPGAAALVRALIGPVLRPYVPAVAVALAARGDLPGGWGRYLVRAALRERFAGEAS